MYLLTWIVSIHSFIVKSKILSHKPSLLKSTSLGIDFGTSGVRICTIDDESKDIINSYEVKYTKNQPNNESDWITCLNSLLSQVPKSTIKDIDSISLCGTSATCLIYNLQTYSTTRNVRMYDYSVVSDDSDKQTLSIISKFCPPNNPALSVTSTLAKLISWNIDMKLSSSERLVHQSDFVKAYLMYQRNDSNNLILNSEFKNFKSDWHNSLKLGYDVLNLSYPNWLYDLLKSQNIDSNILPIVYEPGSVIGSISPHLANKYGFNLKCKIVAGTTDSIAAFLASGANQIGQAVTSLGSTLVIKLLSSKPVEDSNRGIYSHRFMLNDKNQSLWLVGGASNVGCTVLRQEQFSNDELKELSEQIDPLLDSLYQYYPLCKIGERFPINDPLKQPILLPKPTNRKEYLHCILQGIANVEVLGFKVLSELGASPVTEVSIVIVITYIISLLFFTLFVGIYGRRRIKKSDMDSTTTSIISNST